MHALTFSVTTCKFNFQFPSIEPGPVQVVHCILCISWVFKRSISLRISAMKLPNGLRQAGRMYFHTYKQKHVYLSRRDDGVLKSVLWHKTKRSLGYLNSR